jgi:gamma-glutamyltranspeptidase/glutathione hydrolase
MRRGMAGSLARARVVVSSTAGIARVVGPLVLGIALSACGTVDKVSDALFGGGGPQPGQQGYVAGFLGGAVADEPRAALVGREVLSGGGSAADAAVAMGFALSVTLPSRAGLGGGGACLAYAADRKSANGGIPEAVIFTPTAPVAGSGGGDRPAALPMMARGMFMLHARYGTLPFEGLVARAEQLARLGTPASRAFVRDLNLVSGPLLADPTARAVFSRGGMPLTEGQSMVQPELAGTLSQIRISGVGDLYQGALARRIEDSSRQAGGPLSVADLRGALPVLSGALVAPYRNDKVAFLPPPADGGLAAAAAFTVLSRDPNDYGGAAARGLATAARWRAGGISAEAVLKADDLPQSGLPALPASTSFGALDFSGNAVICAVTMDNLFGTGRALPGLGFLLAASPASVPVPLLSAGMAWSDTDHAFRAAVGGSGQAGAPVAVAAGLLNALRTGQPMSVPVPDPGRANVLACARYLPGRSESCAFATDPREAGLASGGG